MISGVYGANGNPRKWFLYERDDFSLKSGVYGANGDPKKILYSYESDVLSKTRV